MDWWQRAAFERNSNFDDDFFDTLYSSYYVKRVRVSRALNCDHFGRGRVDELLISNEPIPRFAHFCF
jgi:hypothetical protein